MVEPQGKIRAMALHIDELFMWLSHWTKLTYPISGSLVARYHHHASGFRRSNVAIFIMFLGVQCLNGSHFARWSRPRYWSVKQQHHSDEHSPWRRLHFQSHFPTISIFFLRLFFDWAVNRLIPLTPYLHRTTKKWKTVNGSISNSIC